MIFWLGNSIGFLRFLDLVCCVISFENKLNEDLNLDPFDV